MTQNLDWKLSHCSGNLRWDKGGSVVLSQTWGEVNKAGGEDCITDNGTENMEFVGHREHGICGPHGKPAQQLC